MTTQWPDGQQTTPWGAAPVGRLSDGVDGRMTAVLMDAARNRAVGRTVPPELQANVASYFGGFAVDTARRVVRHRVTASIRAAESGVLERAYTFQGDSIVLRASGTLDGRSVTHTLVWRRETCPNTGEQSMSRPGAQASEQCRTRDARSRRLIAIRQTDQWHPRTER
jgi:hypothetical protein